MNFEIKLFETEILLLCSLNIFFALGQCALATKRWTKGLFIWKSMNIFSPIRSLFSYGNPGISSAVQLSN